MAKLFWILWRAGWVSAALYFYVATGNRVLMAAVAGVLFIGTEAHGYLIENIRRYVNGVRRDR